MKNIKPEKYTKAGNLNCDSTDKKKFSVHYMMLKFNLRHGMIVDKIDKKISFKQSKWLEKNINFNTQTKN